MNLRGAIASSMRPGGTRARMGQVAVVLTAPLVVRGPPPSLERTRWAARDRPRFRLGDVSVTAGLVNTRPRGPARAARCPIERTENGVDTNRETRPSAFSRSWSMLNYRECSDAELVRAIAGRDEAAYAEVRRRHSSSVMAVARMILRNDPACEEVVSDVFISLWQVPESFDPSRSALLSYLRMRARGRSIDVLRSETRRVQREHREGSQPATTVSDVDAGLMSFEASEVLRRTVAALPRQEGEAISLAFFGEMTYSAVAQYLGEPEGTVKSRIRSGLHRLRDSAAGLIDREGLLVVAE